MLMPGKQTTVKGFVPKLMPSQCSSNVRSWMKGYVGTFAHPYFAVTDADGKFEMKKTPVGKFQLVVWHEEVGFFTMTSKKDRGKVVEIRAEGVTDVGKIGMKAPKD